MFTVLFTAILFLFVTAAMAIGVLIGGSPLKGSCGGKGGPDCICDEYERQKCAARERMLKRLASRES